MFDLPKKSEEPSAPLGYIVGGALKSGLRVRLTVAADTVLLGTVALEPKVVHFFHEPSVGEDAPDVEGTGAPADPGVATTS